MTGGLKGAHEQMISGQPIAFYEDRNSVGRRSARVTLDTSKRRSFRVPPFDQFQITDRPIPGLVAWLAFYVMAIIAALLGA